MESVLLLLQLQQRTSTGNVELVHDCFFVPIFCFCVNGEIDKSFRGVISPFFAVRGKGSRNNGR